MEIPARDGTVAGRIVSVANEFALQLQKEGKEFTVDAAASLTGWVLGDISSEDIEQVVYHHFGKDICRFDRTHPAPSSDDVAAIRTS